jgi:hypothetical protein
MIWVCADCLREGCRGECVQRPSSKPPVETFFEGWSQVALSPEPVVEPVPVPPPDRLNLLRIRHNLFVSGNDKDRKLRILDDAIAVASGDDLRWLTNEREALVLREAAPAPVVVVEPERPRPILRERRRRDDEKEEREYLRRWNEERELFFKMMGTKVPRGKTKAKVPNKTKTKPPRGN